MPDVLLEHAKEDGSWITDSDTMWNNNNNVFDLTETLEELKRKAGAGAEEGSVMLYTTRNRIKNE